VALIKARGKKEISPLTHGAESGAGAVTALSLLVSKRSAGKLELGGNR
jgi:hypothetical protein